MSGSDGLQEAASPALPAGTVALRLIDWQRAHGRHGLPWQGTRDAYRIWLSEIMLQQTQVSTVISYYDRFVARFPDVAALARADLDEVLALWSGLGYYSRARNLHACARRLVAEHGGRFPRSAAELERLPGIGRSTAAAIAAFAFGERAAILDGNVRRVLARVFGVDGFPGERAVEARLWVLAEASLPSPALVERDAQAMGTYTQALMDLGATVCVRARPRCDTCPLADACVARRTGRVDALPGARPRRVVPSRQTAMLLVRRAGRVLVERRPASGIWGGLWSLPESGGIDSAAAAAAEARHRFGLRADRAEALAPFEHAFTHFRLQVQPWLVDVADGDKGQVDRDAASDSAGDTDGPEARDGAGARLRWLAPAEIAHAGLPQPVKRLLRALVAPRLL